MASKSDYLENEVLDHVLGGGDYARPATVYVALYTAAPTDSSTGSSGGTEVSGGNYSRAAVTNNATNFPAASGGSKSNGTAITYPTPSANWGTIVAFAIIDASSGGNILYWGLVTPNKTVNNGDPAPSFAPGDLTITED
jgi:hypothetical protein